MPSITPLGVSYPEMFPAHLDLGTVSVFRVIQYYVFVPFETCYLGQNEGIHKLHLRPNGGLLAVAALVSGGNHLSAAFQLCCIFPAS